MSFEFEGFHVTDLVRGFVGTMLQADASCYWSNDFFKKASQKAIEEGQADGSLPADAGFDDVHPDSLKSIVKFCGEFTRDHGDLITQAEERGFDLESIGADLYFERAGHGVGFRDREALQAPLHEQAEYEELTEIMRDTRETDEKAWQEALDKRNALEALGLAEQLSKAVGTGEVSTTAYKSRAKACQSGFWVGVYLA